MPINHEKYVARSCRGYHGLTFFDSRGKWFFNQNMHTLGSCFNHDLRMSRIGRSYGNSVKPGFGLLCRRGGATVVPVVIDGAFECWPRHKKIFSPGPIEVWYGKAIPAGEVANMSDRELAELMTITLRRMQTESRIQQGKEPYNY